MLKAIATVQGFVPGTIAGTLQAVVQTVGVDPVNPVSAGGGILDNIAPDITPDALRSLVEQATIADLVANYSYTFGPSDYVRVLPKL